MKRGIGEKLSWVDKPHAHIEDKKEGHTCKTIAFKMGMGPETNPIRIPADRIFDKLSNLSTRPTSAC